MVSESHQFRGVISFVVKGIGVDIHDVAKAHVALGTLPMAIGNRYSFSSMFPFLQQFLATCPSKAQEYQLPDS